MRGFEVKTTVFVSKSVEKQLRTIPRHIKESLRNWVVTVERIGLIDARKLPGLHDEPLLGSRKNQRSIRLSRAYRGIYVEIIKGRQILVIKVSKHDY